ncbi:hypothetical protein QJQ45_016554 [Haematococcus lacustris]|nr:hypothetical protein QJQ45_016554 [Haematococcus lacustris]
MSPPGPRRRAGLAQARAIRAKLVSSGSGSAGNLHCGGRHGRHENNDSAMHPTCTDSAKRGVTQSRHAMTRIGGTNGRGDLLSPKKKRKRPVSPATSAAGAVAAGSKISMMRDRLSRKSQRRQVI